MKAGKTIAILERFSQILGIGLLCGAMYWGYQQADFINSSSRTTGQVIGHRESTDSDGSTYYPIVEFLDEGGRRASFESGIGSNPPSFQVGEKVEILISKDRNRKSIDSFFQLWFGPLFLGGFALAFGGPGLIIPIVRMRRREFRKYMLAAGESIETDKFEISVNRSMSVNDRHPYFLKCSLPIGGEKFDFKSGNIWENPTEALKNRKVKIFYIKNNPRKYLVDVSFMEEKDAA